MMTEQQRSLIEAPVGKTLFYFAMPVLLGNIFQSLNGFFNAIFVGNLLGENALAAVSNGNHVVFLMATIMGISMACSILVAQAVGGERIEEAKRVVGTSTVFFLFLSLLLSILGNIFTPQLLDWMNTPQESKELAESYLRIQFFTVPFINMMQFVMAILRGSGDSKIPFYFLAGAVILDIILNPLLIQGTGPLPQMGVAGSSLASLLAQAVSLILMIGYLYYQKYFLRITWKERSYFRLDWVILRAVIQKGTPMALQMFVVASSAFAFIQLVNRFGAEATAAFSAATQLSNYVQMPSFAIGSAVTSMAAQNIGANRWDRVNRITGSGVVIQVFISGMMAAGLLIWNQEALKLFVDDPKTVAIGMEINTITLWSFVIFGIMPVVSGVVRSTGAVMVPLLITIIALWGIRIPFSYWLADIYGLAAIWWTIPIGFTVAVALNTLYYFLGSWREAKMLDQLTPVEIEEAVVVQNTKEKEKAIIR